VRAEWHPAVVRSRILWVDDHKENNTDIAKILRALKIDIIYAASTAEALDAMKVSPFDIVITDVWRPDDPENLKLPLSKCRVHYFDFPDRDLAAKTIKQDEVARFGKERAEQLALQRLNDNANAHSPAGFGLAEVILAAPGKEKVTPDIIFFAADTAEVARPLCGFRITNRIDVLLNSVVSILSERHADTLVKVKADKQRTDKL
jgi:CheY-like chemotaxis protein